MFGLPACGVAADSSVKPHLKFKPGNQEKFVKEHGNEKMQFYRIGILSSLVEDRVSRESKTAFHVSRRPRLTCVEDPPVAWPQTSVASL